MFSCLIHDFFLDIQDEAAAVTREEFDLVFCRLIGAQKTVEFIEAAAVHRCSHDLIEAADNFCSRCHKDPLSAPAGVDIAINNMIRILQNSLGLIGENDLCFRAAGTNQVPVVCNIVNTGKFVAVDTEKFSVFFQSQNIAVGIDPCFIDLIQADQFVTDFVRRITQHQNHLFYTFGDSPEADGKTVAGKDGEDHTDRSAAQFGFDIVGNIIHAAIVSLCTCYNRFCDCDDISVTNRKPFIFSCFQHTVCDDLAQIISLTNDRAADASGYCTDSALFIVHIMFSCP